MIRTSFWFTMTMSTLGLVLGVVFAGADRPLDRARPRPDARPRRRRRPVGADELPAADGALPRRGAVGRSTRSRASRTSSSPSRAMVVFVAVFHWGAVGLVVGNFTGTLVVYVALVVYRTRAARARVRPRPAPQDAEVRDAARPVRARAVDDQLRRPRVRRLVQGPRRGRRLLGRGEDRVGDHVRDDRVPHGVAGVRVLDRGRPRSEAHVLRSSSRTCSRSRRGSRSRSARSRRGGRSCSPTPRYQRAEKGVALLAFAGRRLRRLHRARDRQRPRAPDAAQLGRHGRRRRRERRRSTSGSSRAGAWSARDLDRSPRTSSSSSG